MMMERVLPPMFPGPIEDQIDCTASRCPMEFFGKNSAQASGRNGIVFLNSYARRNPVGEIWPYSSCNRKRSQAARAAGSSWIVSLSFRGGFTRGSAFGNALKPTNARHRLASPTTTLVATRRLKNADFEVNFLFMR